MKKIQLHWQILIALIIAIVFGIIFPTSYMIREKSYKSLIRSKVDPVVLVKIEQLEGVEYETRAEFEDAL
ncbi:hypothetical protein LCGC14_2326590, partial [marine sediment metagenome]